jgi:hypothetical protein
MAKQIIVLEQTAANRFNIAFWLAVPAARQAFYANPSAVSAFKTASAGELSAIQSGAVVEQVGEFSYPAGMGLAAIQSALQAEWTARQAAVTALNSWNRYGTSWDGASWTAGGVA